MKTRRYFVLIYFFLLFVLGCASNNSPSYNVGDRVYVLSETQDHKAIGTITIIESHLFDAKFNYWVHCNGKTTLYTDDFLELADPMPSNKEVLGGQTEKVEQKFH